MDQEPSIHTRLQFAECLQMQRTALRNEIEEECELIENMADNMVKRRDLMHLAELLYGRMHGKKLRMKINIKYYGTELKVGPYKHREEFLTLWRKIVDAYNECEGHYEESKENLKRRVRAREDTCRKLRRTLESLQLQDLDSQTGSYVWGWLWEVENSGDAEPSNYESEQEAGNSVQSDEGWAVYPEHSDAVQSDWDI